MRGNRQPSNAPSKVKFRVVEFEVEGSDTSLAETMKSIQAALAKPTSNPPRALNAPRQIGNADTIDVVANEGVEPEEIENVDDVEVPHPTAPSPEGAQRRPRKVPPVKVVSTVNFESPEPSLRSFVAPYSPPTTDKQRYLLIAAWLKEHRGVDEVDKNLVYTALKFLGWKVPDDVGSVLRWLMKDGLFSRVSGKNGVFAINHIGLDRATKRD